MRLTQLALLASLAAYSQQAEPLRDIDTPMETLMADYVPPNDLDNDPNYYYPTNYRPMNCWECFAAQGKVCVDKGHSGLYHHTGSSDPGDAFCCKPGSNEGYCRHGQVHSLEYEGEVIEEHVTTVCSQPAKGGSAEFQDILTGNMNHQMFAFCPALSHKKCGVPHTSDSAGSTDMNLKAGVNKLTVQTDQMMFSPRSPSNQNSQDYDSCYYEVTLDPSILADWDPKKIHIHFARKSNINVYIYGGKSRMTATESLVAGNAQVSVGQSFTTTPDKGFLIVAYPNQDTPSDFAFNYWVEADPKPEESEEPAPGEGDSSATPVIVNDSGANKIVIEKSQEFKDLEETQLEKEFNSEEDEGNTAEERGSIIPGQEDDFLFYGLCGVAGVLFLGICCVCMKCRKKGQITHMQTKLDGVPMGNNSLHIEDMDEEDYKNQDDTNRPSLLKGGLYDSDEVKQPKRSSYKQVKHGGASALSNQEGTEDPDSRE